MLPLPMPADTKAISFVNDVYEVIVELKKQLKTINFIYKWFSGIKKSDKEDNQLSQMTTI